MLSSSGRQRKTLRQVLRNNGVFYARAAAAAPPGSQPCALHPIRATHMLRPWWPCTLHPFRPPGSEHMGCPNRV